MASLCRGSTVSLWASCPKIILVHGDIQKRVRLLVLSEQPHHLLCMTALSHYPQLQMRSPDWRCHHPGLRRRVRPVRYTNRNERAGDGHRVEGRRGTVLCQRRSPNPVRGSTVGKETAGSIWGKRDHHPHDRSVRLGGPPGHHAQI